MSSHPAGPVLIMIGLAIVVIGLLVWWGGFGWFGRLPGDIRFERETVRNLARAEEQLVGLEDEDDPVTSAVERCLSTFRADRTWVLVHTEYALHATRHPEAAALLRRHAEQLHHRLTALIDAAAGRIGIRLTVPANRLARIVLALHDGVVIREVLGGGATRTAAGDRAASDLERTALFLLLRSATID